MLLQKFTFHKLWKLENKSNILIGNMTVSTSITSEWFHLTITFFSLGHASCVDIPILIWRFVWRLHTTQCIWIPCLCLIAHGDHHSMALHHHVNYFYPHSQPNSAWILPHKPNKQCHYYLLLYNLLDITFHSLVTLSSTYIKPNGIAKSSFLYHCLEFPFVVNKCLIPKSTRSP